MNGRVLSQAYHYVPGATYPKDLFQARIFYS